MGTIEETLKRLQGHRVYLDTNVFIYFLDRNPDFFPVEIDFPLFIRAGGPAAL